jgi:hypothetical protein
VFFQTITMDDGSYMLYAIDSGWIDPQDRNVTLRAPVTGRVESKDSLLCEHIELRDGIARFTVPAGTLRILEAAAY